MRHARMHALRLSCLALLLLPAWPLPGARAACGIDLTYRGPDCTISYRFTPSSGTLNDLTVVYNDSFSFYPSNFGGITAFILAGETLRPWEGRHTCQVLSEGTLGGVYTVRYRWSYRGDWLDFTLRARLEGKTLLVGIESTSRKVSEVGFDRSEGTPGPRLIDLPYGHHVLYTQGIFVSALLDPSASNASAISSMNDLFSSTSLYYGDIATYEPRTDGNRPILGELMRITVSPKIEDAFFCPANPVSAQRAALAGRVVLDLWEDSFQGCRDAVQALADAGLRDLWVLVHAWQKHGYDNGLPTSYPAGQQYGGEAALLEVASLCQANGYLLGLHTNYVDMYPNSEDWDPAALALNSSGAWIPAWYNPDTGVQSYLLKPSRALGFAQTYEPLIHAAYGTNSAFLDVCSAVLPSFKLDYDAAVSGSAIQRSTWELYRELMAYTRSAHGGPLAGEGFGYAASFWAGYIDAIEADPRGLAHTSSSGSDVPAIVDYKLRMLHGLFVPHGVGYLERFYLNQWNGFTKQQLERYRATEIAFGNAGFLSNPFARGIPLAETLREYCFLKHLQQQYVLASPTAIGYWVDEGWMTLSDALRAILPGAPADGLDALLSERLGILKVDYSNGLSVYVNRSQAESLTLSLGGETYTLPPNAFLARRGSEFLAYSAVVDGAWSDYICPAEAICSTCAGHKAYLPLVGR